jgi:hypothetical protein
MFHQWISASHFEVEKIDLAFFPATHLGLSLRPKTWDLRLTILYSLFSPHSLIHCSADQYPFLSTNSNCFEKIQEQKQFRPHSYMSTCVLVYRIASIDQFRLLISTLHSLLSSLHSFLNPIEN